MAKASLSRMTKAESGTTRSARRGDLAVPTESTFRYIFLNLDSDALDEVLRNGAHHVGDDGQEADSPQLKKMPEAGPGLPCRHEVEQLVRLGNDIKGIVFEGKMLLIHYLFPFRLVSGAETQSRNITPDSAVGMQIHRPSLADQFVAIINQQRPPRRGRGVKAQDNRLIPRPIGTS